MLYPLFFRSSITDYVWDGTASLHNSTISIPFHFAMPMYLSRWPYSFADVIKNYEQASSRRSSQFTE